MRILLFNYYGNNYLKYSNRVFINREIMLHSALKIFYCKINSNDYVLPYDSSSIDCSLLLAIKKNYSEYLERTLLGAQLVKDKKIKSYGLKDCSIKTISGSDISYLSKGDFGVSDTTGTSSGGCNSKKIIEKGILELVEKNELGLLWYGMLGSGVNVSANRYQFYLEYFNDVPGTVDEIVILYSNNFSNIHVVYIFLFKDEKLVSSGIGGRFTFIEAFNSAILEAKLLLTIYRDAKFGEYASVSDQECQRIYCHIKKISTIKVYDFNQLNETMQKSDSIEFTFPSLDAFEIVFLNYCNYINSKTIKVCSRMLYNCVPKRENLIEMREIYRLYNINPFQSNIPDCIIV